MLHRHLATAISTTCLFLLPISSFAQFERHQDTPELAACKSYIEERLTDRKVNKYNPADIKETKVDVSSPHYGTIKNSTEFGGHKYLIVNYSTHTMEGGAYGDFSGISTAYCVLDDTNNVMGIEDKIIP